MMRNDCLINKEEENINWILIISILPGLNTDPTGLDLDLDQEVERVKMKIMDGGMEYQQQKVEGLLVIDMIQVCLQG